MFAAGPAFLRAQSQRPSTSFTLGLYQLPTGPNAWQRAREAGFTLIRTAPKREALDEAASHGFRCWCGVGSDLTRIRTVVNELKQHPAIAWWETEDEPSFVWNKPTEFRVAPEKIHAAYRLLKELDPARPVYLNHSPTNLVETLKRYNPGGDLIATDIYPVIPPGIRTQYALWPDGQQGDFSDTTIAQVGRYMDKMRQVAEGRPVMAVLQGFAWENLRKTGDRDARMILYPTRAQVRFMAYQAIAHGASGIIYWGLHTTPPAAPLWDSIAAVAREISSLQLDAPVRSLPEIEYHDTGHSLDRGVEYTFRGDLLLAVNADKNPVEVTFTLPANSRRVEILFENRTLPVSNGKIRETFAAHGVHLYRIV